MSHCAILALQSPKSFERALTNVFNRRESIQEMSDESDEDSDSSSDGEDDSFGRPMSLQDIRREAKEAASSRPGTAASAPKSPEPEPQPLPRHTVI